MAAHHYHPTDLNLFAEKALAWASGFDSACCLDANGYSDPYGRLDRFIAAGEKEGFVSEGSDTFAGLQQFIDTHPGSWIPGFLAYDLKNETEDLQSRHPRHLAFPDAYFFVPLYTLRFYGDSVEIRADDPQQLISVIEQADPATDGDTAAPAPEIKSRMSRSDYLETFESLRQHIIRGDIYEVNLCQEFYAEHTQINPLATYLKLNRVSPTPFSCFFKYRQLYILSASPERFLLKKGLQLIAQPIKGTAPRDPDPDTDELLKQELRTNAKEIAENIMIVDLVRNDLTRSARPGSVKAASLLDVRSFRQVHQLVSTVVCDIQPGLSVTTAIKNTFPAGSMTGAPKISAMELIDRYEYSRRGVYSGAVGYFSPDGDFDFNVVIRTMLYDAASGYLSFHTGGAITANADGDKEYGECLVKARAILEVLNVMDVYA